MYTGYINDMIIYKVTNKFNGKWYIGKDAKNCKSYYGSGIAIKCALKKYGKENFIKEVLEICEDLEALNAREVYWIEKLGAVKDENSYNLANGGQGGNLSKFWKTHKRPKWTTERREKMKGKVSGNKNGMYKKTFSASHIQSIKLANSSRKYFVSEETREKLRLAATNVIQSIETREKMSNSHKKKLIIPFIETGEEFIFNSVKEAVNHFHVSRNKICSRNLKGYKIEEI